LCCLNLFFDDLFAFVKAIPIRFRYGRDRFRRLESFGFKGVNIHGKLVDLAQGRVDVLKFRLVHIKGVLVADHVQHDLGHSGRFSILGALEDDVLHLGTAERFCPLLAEDPRNGVGHVRLAASIRADYGGDPVAGEDYFRMVRKRFEACNF